MGFGWASTITDPVGDFFKGFAPSNPSSYKSMFVNVLSAITAQATIEVMSRCQTKASGEQNIVVQCTNPPGKLYEESDVCLSCIRSRTNEEIAYMQLQESLFAKQSPEVRLPIDTQYERMMSRLLECVSVCKACKLTNVSQSGIIQLETSCSVNQSEFTEITAKMETKLRSFLVQNKGLLSSLSSVVDDIANAKRDYDQIISTLVSSVSQYYNVSVLNEMLLEVSNQQSITLYSNSSAFLTGITQDAMIDVAADYLVNTKVLANLASQAQWDAAFAQYQDDTTLTGAGDLIYSVFSGTYETVFTLLDTIALIMVGLVGILIIVNIVLWAGKSSTSK